MSDRKPAEVFPPGEFIEEELEARNWTQEDLARILGKPLPTINKIIRGKTSVIPDTAKKLAAAFGNSAQFWMNLEATWQLYNSDEKADDVRERAAIYEMAPIREMVRRGWINKTSSQDELSIELCAHFGVGALDEIPTLRAAARSATSGECQPISPEQWAWMCRCRNIASLADAKSYRQKNLRDCIPELVALSNEPEQVRLVPKILREAGVRLVVVQHLKNTRLDGGALCRNDTEPVVAVSLRYGRLDNFWFTLLHEIVHVLEKDGVSADSEIANIGENIDAREERANRVAATWLIPQEALESFIRRTSPLFSERRISNFARRMGVHPSIVLGQLKHEGQLSWDRFNRLNVDVREVVRQSNVSDGWGEVAPIGQE